MQIKIYTIPIIGGEILTEDMNIFLKTKKILQVENQTVTANNGGYWSFCIKYIDDAEIIERDKLKADKIDYRKELDEATFLRYSKLRETRKQLADTDNVPVYAVCTNEELAEMAKLKELTLASIRKISGMGEKKVEKYGQQFINTTFEA
jgi:superfamily II DNA helicase RecQ